MNDVFVNNQQPKTPESTVYIFNMSEDVWPFIDAISDAQARTNEIEENADLGDHTLFGFAQEENVLYIGPRSISDEFLNYYRCLFGIKNVKAIKTRIHTGLICEDILRDEHVLKEIINMANGSKRVNLVSYTTSQQFIRLAEELQKRGITVITPEAPKEEDAWTVNFYGSKSGIRQLAGQSSALEPDFRMADGVIVSGIIDAARIAAKKYIKEKGVVIKTNKGHSGAGVLLFHEGELPIEWDACEQSILSILKRDDYWDMFPIIVESLITVNTSVGGGCPNVEFKVLKNGHVEYLYPCGMRMTPQGVFQGVEIHSDLLSDQVTARIVDTGFFVGEQYRAAGYRGHFEIDFVAGKNGQIYVTESNVRRTGGTHVYHTAVKLFGKDFLHNTYTICHSSYRLPGEKPATFSHMKSLLEPLLFSSETKEGLILTSGNSIHNRHILEYIIFGKTKKRAYEIEQDMERLLAQ